MEKKIRRRGKKRGEEENVKEIVLVLFATQPFYCKSNLYGFILLII